MSNLARRVAKTILGLLLSFFFFVNVRDSLEKYFDRSISV